jgi:hypothetical protein
MRKRSSIVALVYGAIVSIAVLTPSHTAIAQRGVQASRFSPGDLKKLQWIVGRWRGAAQGQTPFYEQYRFANDSTLEITYFSDSSFAKASGKGRVYLTVGRVYHATGPSLWGASRIDESGVFFTPEKNANNSVSWMIKGPDTWIATLRSSATGQEQVTIYEMRRIK